MKKVFSIILTFLLLIIGSTIVLGEVELDGKYMTIKDTRGRVVTMTAHRVVAGDRYLDSDNRLYQVTKVSGETAIAKLVRTERLEAYTGFSFKNMLSSLLQLDFLRAEPKAAGPIAIYHTHSDESYVPTDGVSSKKANGGIFQVGDSLAKAFEQNGVPVVHHKTAHDPHDAMAYDRSRRTAAQLLKQRPSCVLDIHRDAVPRQLYSKVINNQGVTKVQLVVGRQNPNFQANNDFAKRIKAVVDKKNPGFIKGIFYGKGKYNQDMAPRSILLEFGTHTNSKEAAQRGAQIFAGAAKDVLYGRAGGFENRGSMRSLFWILAAVVGGVGLFLLINRSSLKDIGKEFTGAVGEDGAETKHDDSESDQSNNGEPS